MEINHNEVRVGNYVNLHRKYIDPKIIVERISEGHSIHLIGCGEWIATGITLTERILLKCGLERASEFGHQAFWINKDWKIYYCAFNEGARFIDRGWISNMPYLHQLQNLYYSLTGEELEVNL